MTAVEWLLEKWAIQGTLHSSDIAQSIEMEKEQIMNAYIFGAQDEYVIGSQRYYNETFKSE